MKKQNKKTILNQVMKPGDWIKLAILLIVFIFAWFLVWDTYTAPADGEVQVFYGQRNG